MNDLAIVYSTCKKYSFVWDAWYYYFNKYWDIDCPMYTLSDHEDPPFSDFKHIRYDYKSGFWTKMTNDGVRQVPHKHIFFLLDDLFFQKDITEEFRLLYQAFIDLDADSLRITPGKEIKRFKETGRIVNKKPIREISEDYRYLVSYMPIIIKKEFLLKCLGGRKNPWQSEKWGSRTVRGGEHKLYFYNIPGWVINTVRHKDINNVGKKLIAKAK